MADGSWGFLLFLSILYILFFHINGNDNSFTCLPESKKNKKGILETLETFNRWIKVICTHANVDVKNLGSLTFISDVPPAGDIARHATWEQGARGGQADGTDVIWPGYWAGQLHQCQILPIVRLVVTRWNHHPAHTMRRLVRVDAIQLVPASVDDVRAHVGWTERRRRDTEWNLLAWECEPFSFYSDKGDWMAFCQADAPWNGLDVYHVLRTIIFKVRHTCTHFAFWTLDRHAGKLINQMNDQHSAGLLQDFCWWGQLQSGLINRARDLDTDSYTLWLLSCTFHIFFILHTVNICTLSGEYFAHSCAKLYSSLI